MPLPPVFGVGQADECSCPQCGEAEAPVWVRRLLEGVPEAGGAEAAARAQ
jgi:hypothetical protein